MKKYKLLTHTDLDGVSASILAQLLLRGSEIEVEYCNYDNINDKVSSLTLNDLNTYERIFITDISVSFEVASALNNLLDENNMVDKVVLLDHHKTAINLNAFSWANVQVQLGDELCCGTRLFYNYLLRYTGYKPCEWLNNYVEIVNRYDTWLWNTKYNDLVPKKLNQLFYLLGRDKFVEYIIEKDEVKDDILNAEDIKLLEEEDLKIEKYINGKEKTLNIITVDGFQIGVVFAEQYISELGNVLSERHRELSMIAIFNNGKVSLRTVRDDVDCSEFARRFGGGGHKKASGLSISSENMNKMLVNMFS